MEIQVSDLMDLATGAGFLGTGGGGDPYLGRLMLRQVLEEGCDLKIIELEDLPDDALVVASACMGAPTVMVEKIPCVDAAEASLRALERHMGRKADALICIEAGGVNGTLPLVLGARLGLPVVNGDGMGRAFPELQMVTFGVYGNSATPLVLAGEQGDCIVIEARSNRFSENLARANVVAMGAIAQISLYPMNGKAVRQTCVPRTITLALEIGRTIQSARRGKTDPFAALQRYFAGTSPARCARVIFDGKIVDILRETKSGFAKGRVTLAGLDDASETMTVNFQNEFLLAIRDDRPVAMVPDLVVILDRETAEPITTESLKFGQRVKVMAVSVPDVMRTDAALQTFGPAAFGIKHPYIRLEDCAT
jgi:DUF917 family protein